MNRRFIFRLLLAGLGLLGLISLAGFLIYTIIPVFLSRPQPRGPYLQSVTPDSVWIVWDTTQPTRGQVEYGVSSDLDASVEELATAHHHEVQLTGLTPYTNYFYRVDQGEISSFRTAAPEDQTNFRFVVIGDTRTGHRVHRALINRMVDISPDFVIHTGDMVESGRVKSEWDNFFNIGKDLLRSAPFFPTLGNHEDFDPPNFKSPYLDIFHLPGNELWYSFDYGNARFICLKADGYPINVYFPDEEQLNWLEKQLSENEAQWLFVFFHIGIFTSRSEEFLETGLRERLAPMLERYNVDAVFMGHHHSYERLLVNGVTYFITAGGGAPLYDLENPEPGSQVALKAHHFLEMHIEDDVLVGKAIDENGEVVDSFQLQARK